MFKEELNLIKKAEQDADVIRKEGKQEAKAMIEKANTNAHSDCCCSDSPSVSTDTCSCPS